MNKEKSYLNQWVVDQKTNPNYETKKYTNNIPTQTENLNETSK